MEERSLGSTGMQVSAVGMGTWKTFDVSATDEVDARRALVDVALQLGETLFDSSPMYGQAEQVLGMALGTRRPSACVATKVWSEEDDTAEQQVRAALSYYGGYIDLYQVHNLVAWERRLDQLERLLNEGATRAIGATHWRPAAYPELMRVMRTGRLAAIQVPYSPWEREAENEVLPLAAELGLGVLVMRPLGRGQVKTRTPSEDELAPLQDFGVQSWAEAVLKWSLSDRRVTAAIPATESLEHARQDAAAGSPPWFGSDERDYVARLAARAAG